MSGFGCSRFGGADGGGGGGGGATLPLVAWVSPSGSDTTGTVGDIAKPYATPQEAFDDGARHIILLPRASEAYGGIAKSSGTYTFTIEGDATMGNIYINGSATIYLLGGVHVGNIGCTTFSLYGDKSCLIDWLRTNTTSNAAAGTARDCNIAEISVSGTGNFIGCRITPSAAISSQGSTINLYDCVVASACTISGMNGVSVYGGRLNAGVSVYGGGDYYGVAGADVVLMGCDEVLVVYANGVNGGSASDPESTGDPFNGSDGASGGNVTLWNINVVDGVYNGGGAGGAGINGGADGNFGTAGSFTSRFSKYSAYTSGGSTDVLANIEAGVFVP